MNQMNKPSTLILTMPALLVRAHKTDTNAWYPVAATQPRASPVRGRCLGNAHHRRRSEEAAPGQQANWMQFFKRNLKWQKKQSTKQRRFYDNHEAVEGIGWEMGCIYIKQKT